MNKMLLPLLALMLGSTQLPAQPVITNQPANQTVVWGGNATFSVMATGVGPFTYQWQLNGTNLPNNIIATVAGRQADNNQPATNTILNPAGGGVAFDSHGNWFFADSANNVIRKVDTNGMAVIVAGNGSGSFFGDGGAATNAGLSSPYSVVVDLAGNLLIADRGNYRIRKVDTNGIITTVAGGGSVGSGASGPATNANLQFPAGLCLDTNRNLFIADQNLSKVFKVDTNGVITTFVSASGPYGVSVDVSNNLFITDTLNHRILKADQYGNTSTVAGSGTAGYSGDGGAATSAKLNSPRGVVATLSGLFIADSGNNCIRKVSGGIITTVAGNGTNGFFGDGEVATNASLSNPNGVGFSSGELFVTDTGNNRIRKIGTNGIITTVAGKVINNNDFATNVALASPNGITFDSVGNFYIADTGNYCVRKVDTNGFVTTVAGNGLAGYTGDGGMATNASFRQLWDTVIDASGNLFLADASNYRIYKVDTNGIVTTVAGTGSYGLASNGGVATNSKIGQVLGMAIDGTGNLFLADMSGRIYMVGTNGMITTAFNGGSFFMPFDVTLDSSGNLFIANNYGNIIEVFTNGANRIIAGSANRIPGFSGDGGFATNALLSNAKGVVLDAAGNLFVSDSSNGRIRKVNSNGIITTIAGNGTAGYSGDGGIGNHAQLSFPSGLAVDGEGNVYISDSGNNRIRKLAYVDYADQPSFTLTNITLGSLSNNYSVIVTSASGSVTSSVATVDLQLPPITPALTQSNGTFTFTWSAVSNLNYQLQYATNLVAPNWMDLGGPTTATNGSASTTDAAGSDEQRYYRVRLLP